MTVVKFYLQNLNEKFVNLPYVGIVTRQDVHCTGLKLCVLALEIILLQIFASKPGPIFMEDLFAEVLVAM